MKLIYILLMIYILVIHGKKLNKITRGVRTVIEKYPSQVSLYTPQGRICGGTIITAVHILTAANCVVIEAGYIIGNIKVLSGTSDQNDVQYSNFINEVAFVMCHPGYNPHAGWINDICILKLVVPINYSRIRRNVDLPLFYHTNQRFKVTGWGSDKVDRTFTRFLRSIDARVLTPETCRRYFNFYNYHMTDSQSCASTIPSTSWVSNGDGGSGMIHENRIYGIISIRIPNRKKTFVFTRVSYFTDWIRYMINYYY